MESILDSIKKAIGITPEDKSFDPDLIMHINSEFAKLSQIGCGPEEGFSISGSNSIWNDYLSDQKTLNFVQSYMAIRVRLLFDPPTNSSIAQALKASADEYEWRISVEVDPKKG